MRTTLAAAVIALTLPATAHAQTEYDVESLTEEGAPDDRADISALTERLRDPAEQERIAGMIHALGEVMLALPVGAFVDSLAPAVEEATGEALPTIDRDATLADMAGPEARDVPRTLSEKTPQMMGALAGLAEGLEALRPVLEQFAASARGAVETDLR